MCVSDVIVTAEFRGEKGIKGPTHRGRLRLSCERIYHSEGQRRVTGQEEGGLDCISAICHSPFIDGE